MSEISSNKSIQTYPSTYIREYFLLTYDIHPNQRDWQHEWELPSISEPSLSHVWIFLHVWKRLQHKHHFAFVPQMDQHHRKQVEHIYLIVDCIQGSFLILTCTMLMKRSFLRRQRWKSERGFNCMKELRCNGFTFLKLSVIPECNKSFSSEGSKKMIGEVEACVCASEADEYVIMILLWQSHHSRRGGGAAVSHLNKQLVS